MPAVPAESDQVPAVPAEGDQVPAVPVESDQVPAWGTLKETWEGSNVSLESRLMQLGSNILFSNCKTLQLTLICRRL